MSDLFGAPAPPPVTKPARRKASPPPPLPVPQPAAAPPAEPAPCPAPAQPAATLITVAYGMQTLHDGRQVDSGSTEWRQECLARSLLRLEFAEREAFLAGLAEAEDLRALMRGLRAARAAK